MKYIDLHTHSTCSDGLCTVQELLRKAQDIKMSAFSVSDHNTVHFRWNKNVFWSAFVKNKDYIKAAEVIFMD
jgi:histidinol phosphatase-like PHP family hydrolase